MFKVQVARRGKIVELHPDDYGRIVWQPCEYRGATERIGVGRLHRDNDGHYTLANSVPCCARCNFMKGSVRLEDFAAHARLISTRMGAWDLL